MLALKFHPLIPVLVSKFYFVNNLFQKRIQSLSADIKVSPAFFGKPFQQLIILFLKIVCLSYFLFEFVWVPHLTTGLFHFSHL